MSGGRLQPTPGSALRSLDRSSRSSSDQSSSAQLRGRSPQAGPQAFSILFNSREHRLKRTDLDLQACAGFTPRRLWMPRQGGDASAERALCPMRLSKLRQLFRRMLGCIVRLSFLPAHFRILLNLSSLRACDISTFVATAATNRDMQAEQLPKILALNAGLSQPDRIARGAFHREVRSSVIEIGRQVACSRGEDRCKKCTR
jgi:hypothetical protein